MNANADRTLALGTLVVLHSYLFVIFVIRSFCVAGAVQFLLWHVCFQIWALSHHMRPSATCRAVQPVKARLTDTAVARHVMTSRVWCYRIEVFRVCMRQSTAASGSLLNSRTSEYFKSICGFRILRFTLKPENWIPHYSLRYSNIHKPLKRTKKKRKINLLQVHRPIPWPLPCIKGHQLSFFPWATSFYTVVLFAAKYEMIRLIFCSCFEASLWKKITSYFFKHRITDGHVPSVLSEPTRQGTFVRSIEGYNSV